MGRRFPSLRPCGASAVPSHSVRLPPRSRSVRDLHERAPGAGRLGLGGCESRGHPILHGGPRAGRPDAPPKAPAETFLDRPQARRCARLLRLPPAHGPRGVQPGAADPHTAEGPDAALLSERGGRPRTARLRRRGGAAGRIRGGAPALGPPRVAVLVRPAAGGGARSRCDRRGSRHRAGSRSRQGREGARRPSRPARLRGARRLFREAGGRATPAPRSSPFAAPASRGGRSSAT